MYKTNLPQIDITLTFAHFEPYWEQWDLPTDDHDYLVYEKLSESLQDLKIGTQHPNIERLGGLKGSEFGGIRFYYTLNPEQLGQLIKFAHEWAIAHVYIVQIKSFLGSTVILPPDARLSSIEIEGAVKALINYKPGIKPKTHEADEEGDLIEAAIDQKTLVSLRHILQTKFNESEVRQISFDLGIDYENLEGNNFADRVISLLNYLKRRNNLSALIELGNSLRGDIAWPNKYKRF